MPLVEVVGTAGAGSNGVNAREMEYRMNLAAENCYAEGITDPEAVRAAKLKAREDYKQELRNVAAEEAKGGSK